MRQRKEHSMSHTDQSFNAKAERLAIEGLIEAGVDSTYIMTVRGHVVNGAIATQLEGREASKPFNIQRVGCEHWVEAQD